MNVVCKMTGEATTWPCSAHGCPLYGDCLSEYTGKSKPMINAARIRAMSDDSLLEFFANLAGNVGCPPGSHGKCGEKRQYGDDACRKCWEEYLQQPAEEET